MFTHLMKTPLIVLIVVAILAGVFLLVRPQRTEDMSTHENTSGTEQKEQDGEVEDFTSQKEVGVEIKDYVFSPGVIKIKKGTKVTWTNRDIARHNAQADDMSFKTELLGKDESGSVTFNQPGTFSYICGPHPYMKGTVEVVE